MFIRKSQIENYVIKRETRAAKRATDKQKARQDKIVDTYKKALKNYKVQHFKDVEALEQMREYRDYFEYFAHIAAPEITAQMEKLGASKYALDFGSWKASKCKKKEEKVKALLRVVG